MVRPAAAASSRAVASAGGRAEAPSSSSTNRSRPAAATTPDTVPVTPRPSWLANPSTGGSAPTSAAAPAAMAAAMGCSLAASSAPTMRSRSARPVPACAASTRATSIKDTSIRDMAPVVTVPVLSRTMVSTRRVLSRTSGPLIRIPSCAPRPVPTMSAVGVARPRAHGQAMIKTATAAVKASVVGAPAPSQKPRVATAIAMTTGTKIAEIRSANRWTSALPVWASWTSWAMRASAVSAPTRVASTTRRPEVLTVAPTTASPGPTSTGTGSPVSNDVSTAERPSTTRPSVATFSPGRTTKRSPTASSSTAMRTSSPPRRTATSLAPSSRSACRAAPDRRFARASNHRPARISTTTTAAVSR